jgi:hypothetical protein
VARLAGGALIGSKCCLCGSSRCAECSSDGPSAARVLGRSKDSLDFSSGTTDSSQTLKYPSAEMDYMKLSVAIERLERVVATRSDADAISDELTGALRASKELGAFLAAAEADLVGRLASATSFPEAAISEATRESLGSSTKAIERSRTLESAPALAAALDDAAVTPGHVDAVTRSANGLDAAQRQKLLDRVDDLVDVAATATVEQFGRRIRTEVKPHHQRRRCLPLGTAATLHVDVHVDRWRGYVEHTRQVRPGHGAVGVLCA